MRKGRGIDHYWDVRKYKGDAAYYAFCKCKYYYACGSILHKDKPLTLYPYCPNCGAHKKWYNPEPKQMSQSIFDLYGR